MTTPTGHPAVVALTGTATLSDGTTASFIIDNDGHSISARATLTATAPRLGGIDEVLSVAGEALRQAGLLADDPDALAAARMRYVGLA